ncbi:preprotein translocase subunit SecY [Candidatus Gracilibacteria bacterium]|nr:preprotein translocase subunit SecY [Candidatus Gracilibacteria bacterium]
MGYLKNIWKIKDLRQRILFVFFGLILFRLAAHIPVPFADMSALAQVFAQNQMLGVFSALTGGSMESFSIVMMGLAPYINAAIIMQLMTVVIPGLERMKNEEGEEGQKKINSYTRWLTLPLAILQSYGMIALMNMSAGTNVVNLGDLSVLIPVILSIAAGTVFLMWLGELMTEKGIGNGISLIIFTGIVAAIPPIFGKIFGMAAIDSSKILPFIIFLGVIILMLILVVIFSEAQRNISVTYATAGGTATKGNLPIRINQAGMIPIIFAIAMITFPTVIASFMQKSANETVQSVSTWILANLSGSNPNFIYMGLYFLLIFAFTYFYVSVTFKPEKAAENIQKKGGFITGLRPGSQTSEYIENVSTNLNFWGGGFLATVAVIPLIFVKYTDLTQSDLLITGSGLIIVVGVVLELIRQVNARLVMNDYEAIK